MNQNAGESQNFKNNIYFHNRNFEFQITIKEQRTRPTDLLNIHYHPFPSLPQ